MESFKSALDYVSGTQVFGVTLARYLLAFLCIFLAVVLRRVFTSLVLRAIRRVTRRTRTELDDVILDAISQPIAFGVILIGLHQAAVILRLPREPVDVRTVTFDALQALVIINVAWLVFRILDGLSGHFASLSARTETLIDDQLIPLLRKSLKIFVGVLAFLSIVQTLGYSVTSLIAGLGIGGLAIALAAQDTVSNLFGSVTILLDRPFRIGDWIEAGDQEGVVEEIGFRSTRVRTFAKTLVSIPNSVLANSVVNNWSLMPIRRVKMVVGVTYESSADQMEQAVEGIRKLLREDEAVSQEFFLVNFTDFGASSLDIFVYYFTTSTVWAEYLDVRQRINLKIMRLLEELGMEVAFPTRTVYLRNDDEQATSPA